MEATKYYEIILFIFINVFLRRSKGYCIFPKYLWSPVAKDALDKHWTSHTAYAGSGDWTWQTEIGVRATQMTVKVVTKAVCFDQHNNETSECLRKDLLHRIVCLTEELDDKFRVHVVGNGHAEFSCYKFMARGRNVVQIWSAVTSKTNDDSLCTNSKLNRDAWPWIVQRKEEWVFCPLIGGFDFRVYIRGKKKPVCSGPSSKSKHHWRPSRLESECALGEGIHVQFPDDKCNILEGNLQEGPLFCWANWIEGQHEFTVIGRSDQVSSQFVMRFTSNTTQAKEFNADLFYSPITLFENERKPEDILQVNLHLTRSDPGVCYDESEQCLHFSRDGKCINSALHKYANFCKKSCGLCGHKADLVPSTKSECYFPEEYRGRWLLFETDRMEEVTIGGGHVTFSKLGTYICKSKHWKKDQYKMLTVYDNGCRPKFSCMHFRLDGIVLYFQMSKSSELDKSFELCEFRDDPEPLKDKIRSRKMKILLPEARLHFGGCGLRGQVLVNASFPDDISCDGSLSDWDTDTCQSKPNLSLGLRHCSGRHNKEYQCMAHMELNDGTSVLITKDLLYASVYQCWVVHTHSERMSYRPWKHVSVFDKGQCGTSNDVMSLSCDNLVMTIITSTEFVSTPCSSHHSRSSTWIYRETSYPSNRVTSPRPEFFAPYQRWPKYTVLSAATESSRGLSLKIHSSDNDLSSSNEGNQLKLNSFLICLFFALLRALKIGTILWCVGTIF